MEVAGAIDHAHAAFADGLDDAKVSQRATDHGSPLTGLLRVPSAERGIRRRIPERGAEPRELVGGRARNRE
jgi:hypothetical protein